MQKIEELCELAPLHNPAGLLGIKAFMKRLPNACSVAVFDTSFHQTLSPETYLYPIPYRLYDQYKIRKYGFHGTNHQYVAHEAANILEKPLESLKIISCHLGNGSSICAIENGKSVNTSMGFTPLAGLMMGTRSGTIDPSIIPYMMEKTGYSIDEVLEVFNKESGLLGISGISNDFRDVEQASKHNDERARLAIKMFIDRIVEYIGSYVALMNGVDAIVFTAGIGENSSAVRQAIVSKLGYLGAKMDMELNENRAACIHTPDSKVSLLVIPANEELMIVRDTWRLSKAQQYIRMTVNELLPVPEKRAVAVLQ
jgi:acetate kinase/propionate kinase